MKNSVFQTYQDIQKIKKIKSGTIDISTYENILKEIKKITKCDKITNKTHHYTTYYILNKILCVPDSKINSIINLFDNNDVFLNLVLKYDKLIINDPGKFLINALKSANSLSCDQIKTQLIKSTFLKYNVPNNLINLYRQVYVSYHFNTNFRNTFSNLLWTLISSVGCGESLYENIKKFSINYNDSKFIFPLSTKKECHNYLLNNNHEFFEEAIINSIVCSNGGTKKLAEKINFNDSYIFIGRIFDEKLNIKKYELIKWFCKIECQLAESDYNKIPLIINFLERHGYFNNVRNSFCLKGKTFSSITKQLHAWEKLTTIQQYSYLPQKWEKSFIQNFEFNMQSISPECDDIYTINEILNIDDLYNEGKELRHCILSYMYKIFDKVPSSKITIWSLKKNGNRVLTITLNNQNKINASQGFCNRYPTDDEKRIIEIWNNKIALQNSNLIDKQLILFTI